MYIAQRCRSEYERRATRTAVLYVCLCTLTLLHIPTSFPFAHRILLIFFSLRFCLRFGVLGSRVGVRFRRDLGIVRVARAPRSNHQSDDDQPPVRETLQVCLLSCANEAFLTTFLFFFSAMMTLYPSNNRCVVFTCARNPSVFMFFEGEPQQLHGSL